MESSAVREETVFIDAYFWDHYAPRDAEYVDIGHKDAYFFYRSGDRELINEDGKTALIDSCVGHDKLYRGSRVYKRFF
jgi:hypothetical protein